MRVRQIIDFFTGHQTDWSDCSYPTVAKGALLEGRGRVSPLILRALGVETSEAVVHPHGPLGFLSDHGDRLVAAHAILANIPVILTTDRKTFWSQREQMAQFGVAVVRPAELLKLYRAYWATSDQ